MIIKRVEIKVTLDNKRRDCHEWWYEHDLGTAGGEL